LDFEGLEEVIAYEGKQFVSDLEGPVTKNDNALELCEHYVDHGREIFFLIERYEDVLAEVLHRSGYKTGDALRLILPFLKAFGATDNGLMEHAKNNVAVLPGADKAMRYVQEIMASFIVSTSYEHYVSAVCEAIGFPFESAFCTRVSLDQIRMDEWESRTIRNLAEEMSRMPLIEIPSGARSMASFSSRDQRTLLRLDEIFWTEMTDLPSFRLVMEVNPVGGEEKAATVVDICKKTGIGIEDTMYVGDGHTDVQAMRLVKRGGGMAISFNGNAPAVREADVAVLSPNAVVTSVIAEEFFKGGKDAVLEMVDRWGIDGIRRNGRVNEYLIKEMERVFSNRLPKVERVSANNIERLSESSAVFRRSVRGESVGSVG
jgi:energy-converting hydrogenase A subunit R